MAETEQRRIRVRHYTRTSSKERILVDGCIIARDQHRVFVERASRQPLSRRQAEATYMLKRGKGNAYVEFDAFSEELLQQTNRFTGATEFFLQGDVDLSTRHPQGYENR